MGFGSLTAKTTPLRACVLERSLELGLRVDQFLDVVGLARCISRDGGKG